VRQHPSGSLVVEGRAGDVINRGGEKVSAAELEAALIQHAGTAAVAVVGARHATLGERVCACVVPRAAVSVGLADLRRFLREQGFAAYKLPERLLVLGELPLTPFGKVDRKSLRERVAGTEATRNPTAVTQAGSLEVGRDGRYDAPAS
jgi:non-ribosomal peptide synthetase component E (peptide arylation enzyme)